MSDLQLFESTKSTKKQDWQRKGCKEGEKRFMFIVKEDLVEKIYNVAYWERLSKKEALEEALLQYISAHKEEANKERPEKK